MHYKTFNKFLSKSIQRTYMAGFPKAYVHYDAQSITWIGAWIY